MDWSAYRTTFETEASRLLGHRVVVAGKADARLLPTPMLAFEDVRIGDDGGPSVRVEQFETRIELMPLFSGEVRIIDMVLDNPDVSVSVQDDGSLDWIDLKSTPETQELSFVFDAVTIRGGSFRLDDKRNGRTFLVENINASLSARSLQGPYKIEGSGLFDGQRYSAIIATGLADDTGLRSKISLVPAHRPVTLALDGRISRPDQTLRYEGRFDLQELSLEAQDDNDQQANRWTSRGSFELTSAMLRLPEFTTIFGSEGQAGSYTFSGAGSLDYSRAPRLDAVLTSRQIDLDRALGDGPDKPVSVEKALSALSDTARSIAWPGIDGKIGFDVPGIVVAGDLIQSVQLDLSMSPNGAIVDTLRGRLPGGTDVLLSGEAGGNGQFIKGPLTLSTDQPDVFLNWLGLAVEQGTSGRPRDGLVLKGGLSLGPDGWSLDRFNLTSGKTVLRGSVQHQSGENSVLDVDAQTKTVRLDLLTAFGTLLRGAGPSSGIKLAFQAGQIESEQGNAQGVDVSVAFDGQNLKVDRLKVADLAGASLKGEGQFERIFSEPRGNMTLDLKAQRFSGVIAFLEAAGLPQSLSQRLRNAEPALRNIDLSLAADAGAEEGSARFTGQVRGKIGETELALDAFVQGSPARPVDAEWVLSADMSNPKTLPLLRQLGIDVVPVEPGGSAMISAVFDGKPSEGGALKVDLNLGGTQAQFDGDGGIQNDTLMLSGAVSLVSDDVLPLVLTLGQPLPGYGATRLDSNLTSRLSVKDRQISFADVKGQLSQQSLSGALTVDLRRERPKAEGTFSVPELSLEAVMSSILGDGVSLEPEAAPIWSETVFGDALAGDVAFDLSLDVERLVLAGTKTISNADLTTRYRPSSLTVTLDKGGFAGGEASGQLQIDRIDDTVRSEIRVQLSENRAEELLWVSRASGLPLVDGDLSVTAQLMSEGRSLSGLVANLGGEGTFNLKEGALQQMNPAAFGLIIRAVDGGLEVSDERLKDLFAGHLDSGALSFSQASGAFSLSNGVARSRNVTFDTGRQATTFANGQMDFRSLELESAWTLSVDAGEDAVAGGRPEAALVFSGDMRQPERAIDLSTFVGFLTIRAFEQEVEEIERLQDDILERDYLSRELRRIKQERDRHLSARNEPAEAPLPSDGESEASVEDTVTGGQARRPAVSQVPEPEIEAPEVQAPEVQTPVTTAPSSRPRTVAPKKPARKQLSDQDQASFENLIRGALSETDDLLDPNPPETETLLPPLDAPVEIGPVN